MSATLLSLNREFSVVRPWSIVALAVLVAVAAAPHGAAHGTESHGVEQTQLVENVYTTFRIPASIVMTQTRTALTVATFDPNTPGNSGVDNVSLTLNAPSGESQEIALGPGGVNAFTADVTFDETGTWRANVTLHPLGNGTSFSFPVYKRNAYIYDSAASGSALGDIFVVNHSATIRLLVQDWRTASPAPDATDVTFLIEHWTDDHARKLSEFTVPAQPEGDGVVAAETRLPATGMYHVYLASETWRLEYFDRPYVHVFAITEDQAEDYGIVLPKKTPASGVVLLFAAAALAALVWRRR